MNNSTASLFDINEKNDFIELIYHTNNGIKANEIGNAIIGMSLCFSEIVKISELNDVELFVFPIEKGSLKTKFKVIAPVAISVTGLVALLSNSMNIIQFFGSKRAFNPDQEVLSQLTDPRILGACTSRKFIEGSRKVAGPLSDSIESVEIKYNSEGITINCQNKEKFNEEIDNITFPELKNGIEIKLVGEIVRLNKEYNDLGFKFRGRMLKCIPMDLNGDIAAYHNFLEDSQVVITGRVLRPDENEMPQIQIISIDKIESKQEKINFIE